MSGTPEFSIKALSGALGAEITNIDLKSPISDDLRLKLRAAWLEHLVLLFPDQHLTNEELKRFASIWGPLVAYAAAANPGEDQEVVELRASAGNIADLWHADQTFQANSPIGSVLNMIKLPALGGDTLWMSQYAAYENLSPPIRDLVDGLTAIHHLPEKLKKTPGLADQSVERPVVDVHSETGRRCLSVNQMYTARIPQISQTESDTLLAFLFRHAEDPRFAIRYRWSEGTVAIWDNRCTQHCGINDFEGERIIRRVTVGAEKRTWPKGRWDHYKPARLTARGRLAD